MASRCNCYIESLDIDLHCDIHHCVHGRFGNHGWWQIVVFIRWYRNNTFIAIVVVWWITSGKQTEIFLEISAYDTFYIILSLIWSRPVLRYCTWVYANVYLFACGCELVFCFTVIHKGVVYDKPTLDNVLPIWTHSGLITFNHEWRLLI